MRPSSTPREFTGYDIRSALRIGWAGKKNGELLRDMVAEGYEILLTTDRNLPYQQNLRKSGIAVIVLAGRSNRLEDLIPLVSSVLAALTSIQPGDVVEIST